MARYGGKQKYIETPEKMWEYFVQYRTETKNNPIYIIEQKKGNISIPRGEKITPKMLEKIVGATVSLPVQRPLTLEGFENWCADNNIIQNLAHYFCNLDNRYENYITVCSRIRRVIRQDQIEGGMVGIYNPSITQRLNGLVEKTETKVNIEQPLFGDENE